MALKFAHIINPFNPGPSSVGAKVQSITAECMRRAAHFYGEDNVTLISAQYEEDLEVVPKDFVITENLLRSLNDVSGLHGTKKLPLIGDILEKLAAFAIADFFIYSNTDISPVPAFYKNIETILQKTGCDALIINRRRLPEEWMNRPIEELVLEKGESHPGYDCFVFKRELLPQFEFGNVAVGIPGIGFMFAHNLFLRSNACKVLYHEHLTFHLGMEIVKPWSSKEEVGFQHAEILKFMRKHKSEFEVSKFPGYQLPFFKRHHFWLMNPLFHYPTMLLIDLKKLGDGRKIIHDSEEESIVNQMVRVK